MKTLFLFVLLFSLYDLFKCQQFEMEKIREWKQLDFLFPDDRTRSEAIQKKLFIPKNPFPIDVEVDYKNSLTNSRIFVTIPRFNPGIPITLGYVSSKKSDLLIKPYPDYSWHSSNGANCDKITSVLRVAIDECQHLWVLDTGVTEVGRKCPPQLLVFNLNNDKLVLQYKFPQSQYTDASLYITPIVDSDSSNKCANTKVYIADVTGFALIVYDRLSNRSWKIQNKLFYPYPQYGTFTYAGSSFDLMDGIFGMSISSKSKADSQNTIYGNANRNDRRVLFFHSLASEVENFVPLRLINNASIWNDNSNAQPKAFKTMGRRGIQTAAQAIDRNGNLFFVLLDPLAIVCWDSLTPYTRDNIRIVYRNDETLQFASGVKIRKNLSGDEELWVMTNRFQKIATGTVNSNEINYRIQVKNIRELLRQQGRCNGQSLNEYNNFVFPNALESRWDSAEY